VYKRKAEPAPYSNPIGFERRQLVTIYDAWDNHGGNCTLPQSRRQSKYDVLCLSAIITLSGTKSLFTVIWQHKNIYSLYVNTCPLFTVYIPVPGQTLLLVTPDHYLKCMCQYPDTVYYVSTCTRPLFTMYVLVPGHRLLCKR
jgi:hypothetical protein